MTRAGLRCGLAAVACALGVAAPATATTEGPCTAFFNGVEAERVGSISSPLLLDAEDTLVFSGSDQNGTRNAEVSVRLGPVTLGRAASSHSIADPEFAASLDLDGVAQRGVGLLQVHATTDNCTVRAWLRVEGRLPFTTRVGLGGSVMALVGLAGQALALIARRRWSPWVAGVSGVFTGAVAALLGQQFGRLQLSYLSLAVCAALAAAIGLGLALLLRRRREPDEEDDFRWAKAAERPVEEAPLPTPGPAAAPRLPAPPPLEQNLPYWCYVLADTKVLHLDDHTRVVATLHPGTWYLVKREMTGWAHVEAAPGVEGWASRRALHRED